MAKSTQDIDFEDLKKIFEHSSDTIDEQPETWLRLIRDKLYSMLCSPIKAEYRQETFKWVSHLCLSLGDFSWISPSNEWTQDEAKIFSCIALLSVAEVHILLPLIQRHLTCGNEPDIEDGKVLARSASSEDYDKFGDHLVILESAIRSLVKGQDMDSDEQGASNRLTESIRSRDLSNLLQRMKEVATLVCDHLELVHRHWHELIEEIGSEKFSSAEGALRIICVWISEDPGSFEPQCKRFLIDLILKNLLLTAPSSAADLLITALHSICSGDQELIRLLKNLPNHEQALSKYLTYVQDEQRKSIGERSKKLFKLRCGLIRDLLQDTNEL